MYKSFMLNLDNPKNQVILEEYASAIGCTVFTAATIISGKNTSFEDALQELETLENNTNPTQLYAQVTVDNILSKKLRYAFQKTNDPVIKAIKKFYSILPLKNKITFKVILNTLDKIEFQKTVNNLRQVFKQDESPMDFPKCTIFIDSEPWNPYLD